MYLQKQEIKGIKFPEPESSLNLLFNNKKVKEFLDEVHRLREKNGKVSEQAEYYEKHFISILEKAERAKKILESPKDDWKVNKIDPRSQLGVRVKGTNVEIRYEGLLSLDIENICVMIYQVNLYDKWVPFCKEGRDLREVTPIEKLCYLTFKIPFISDRYSYFYGLGMDRIDENGTIMIYGEGITENQELMNRFNLQQTEKQKTKMVVLDLKYFICQISYRSETQFMFKCYVELDSHMSILPEWLVQTIIKKMGGFIFDTLIKLSKGYKGSAWQKQKMEDKDNPFYPWLHNRIQKWHEMNREAKKSKM